MRMIFTPDRHQNHKVQRSAAWILSLWFLSLTSCQTMSMLSQPSGVGRSWTLELKGLPGDVGQTRYYSHSEIHAYEQDQLIKERDEIVDFSVAEKVTKFDKALKRISMTVSTVRKDGVVDLHDLAFPEKGEEIGFVYGHQGQVWQAGEYPPDSVFFIPPLPLPSGPVSVGDTWTMDHAWVGLKNGVPLGVHMVAILKQVKPCGAKDQCAELEVSGNVEVIAASGGGVSFSSQIWGRILFAINRGGVVWSEVRSRELMQTPDGRMQVLSCMTSQVEKPSGFAPKNSAAPFCKPGSAQVRSSPQI